jgi:hypothetical protein
MPPSEVEQIKTDIDSHLATEEAAAKTAIESHLPLVFSVIAVALICLVIGYELGKHFH